MMPTSMNELMKIVNGEHADPHVVLGMHDIKTETGEFTIVRVFNPEAASIELYNPKKKGEPHTFELEHSSGFFIATMPKQKHFRYKLKFTGHSGNQWESWDPYTFAPVLSELDLHLFGQGTHYEIYNKLGATAMKIDGVEGVLFAVWAPNARRISIVGDFNGWNGLRHPMRHLGTSGVWELFVPGLVNYDKYKFEIKSHTGAFFSKADPYAFFSELRPSTASMVFDIEGYKWGDSKWVNNRNKKDPLDGPMNVYELHAGSWKRVAEEGYRFMSWPE